MASALTATYFSDDDKAREYLESLRWPHGVTCPHCGTIGDHYQLEGKVHRPGLWKCKDCREQFSVTVGTVFESSKIPLSKWLTAVYLLCSSKKSIGIWQDSSSKIIWRIETEYYSLSYPVNLRFKQS